MKASSKATTAAQAAERGLNDLAHMFAEMEANAAEAARALNAWALSMLPFLDALREAERLRLLRRLRYTLALGSAVALWVLYALKATVQ